MRTVFRRMSVLTLVLLMLMQSSLAAFLPVKDPVDFSDVPSSHWASYYIRCAYEHGLMTGTGENTFSPSGTVSVAQAIMVAVR